MKTLIAVISFSLMGIGAFAQTAGGKTVTKTSNYTPHPVVAYKCPVCGTSSPKAGDCTKDKVAMVKVGDYYCPDCYMSSSKAGKCSMCGVDMKKMEATTGTK
jgi:hypothetical protein